MRWVLDISSVVLGRGLRSVTTHNALPRTVTRSLSSSLLVTPNVTRVDAAPPLRQSVKIDRCLLLTTTPLPRDRRRTEARALAPPVYYSSYSNLASRVGNLAMRAS